MLATPVVTALSGLLFSIAALETYDFALTSAVGDEALQFAALDSTLGVLERLLAATAAAAAAK
jgi:hypothetical protein